jgi:hypothetical protein
MLAEIERRTSDIPPGSCSTATSVPN